MKSQAFFIFLWSCSLVTAASIGAPDARDAAADSCYDAIVVGGGPAGLSALSGLARVRRRAILIDSGEYRNNATRHMHDVIGVDGVTPAYFRWLARSKLAYYDSVFLTNGTVTRIQPQNTTSPSYTVQVVLPTFGATTLTTRSVVLATGLKDLIPSTPGLAENWGQGIFWCPWCDGNEHADQPLGLLGPLDQVAGMVREISTLNMALTAYVNGTDTPAARAAADAKFPGWGAYLEANDVTVYNQTIAGVTRLADGGGAGAAGWDPAVPTHPEHDLFRVDLDDGTAVEQAAFFASFPNEQRSSLGRDLGVTLYGDRLAGDQDKGYLTNVPMVYAAGDVNIDNSTNVPHAMYSGKKSAVFLHVALARQEAAAQLAAAGDVGSAALSQRAVRDVQPREIWDVMNGEPGDLFYAGHFDTGEKY